MSADPKPPARVRDPELLRRLHLKWRDCALSLADLPYCLGVSRLSLHHIHKHPRDDLRENLVMLCGSGTTGCHGAVERADPDARRELAKYIRFYRPDTYAYLIEKLGGVEAAREWLRV